MEKKPATGESEGGAASQSTRSAEPLADPVAPDPAKFNVKPDFGSGFVPDRNLTGETAPPPQDPGDYDLRLGKETTILYIGRKLRRKRDR